MASYLSGWIIQIQSDINRLMCSNIVVLLEWKVTNHLEYSKVLVIQPRSMSQYVFLSKERHLGLLNMTWKNFFLKTAIHYWYNHPKKSFIDVLFHFVMTSNKISSIKWRQASFSLSFRGLRMSYNRWVEILKINLLRLAREYYFVRNKPWRGHLCSWQQLPIYSRFFIDGKTFFYKELFSCLNRLSRTNETVILSWSIVYNLPQSSQLCHPSFWNTDIVRTSNHCQSEMHLLQICIVATWIGFFSRQRGYTNE